MIFLVQFEINKRLWIFSKTTNCTRPTGLCNFVSLKKFTHTYLFQIALEIMWLTIQNAKLIFRFKISAGNLGNNDWWLAS